MSNITNFGSENSKMMVSNAYYVIFKCYVIVIFSYFSIFRSSYDFLYLIGDAEFEFEVKNLLLRNASQLRNSPFLYLTKILKIGLLFSRFFHKWRKNFKIIPTCDQRESPKILPSCLRKDTFKIVPTCVRKFQLG